MLQRLIPFAPDHLPHEIDAIKQFEDSYHGLEQVACFDTAFHMTMPDVAKIYALPEEVRREGVQRYGFHGLSYEYVMDELSKEVNPEEADGRVVIAHLGNGASMAGIKKGKSMDTTMGFTPAGGLVMSTRCGDIDPGVMVYLVREKAIKADALNRIVNKESGLLGLSGVSSDMQQLMEAEKENPRAAAAIEAFCYQARKFIGSLAAVLGGLDTLVFTAGIGENDSRIRERICTGLAFLGIELDEDRNRVNAAIISGDQSRVTVRVMKTNEELMIARHTYKLISGLRSKAA
jgi:acetate kinase